MASQDLPAGGVGGETGMFVPPTQGVSQSSVSLFNFTRVICIYGVTARLFQWW